MKTPVTAAVAAVLLLTACAGDTQPAETPTSAAPVVETETASTAPVDDETVPPLVAEVETDDEQSPEPETPEEAFLITVRDWLDPETTQIPNATDEQLLEAGREACEQLASENEDGSPVSLFDVRVIEGEVERDQGGYIDSLQVAAAAQQELCP